MHTFVLVLVVSLSACSFVSADDDSPQGKIHTQEGSICEWSRVDYVKGDTIQRFHLDCTCRDESGEDEKYSCTYQGNLKKCLTANEKIVAQEKHLFHELSIEARGKRKIQLVLESLGNNVPLFYSRAGSCLC